MFRKSKQEKAIGILYRQRDKLDKPDYLPDSSWLAQTSAYVKVFIGEGEQYNYISKFKFRALNFETTAQQFEENKRKARKFLRECIETIEDIGLYIPPKKKLPIRYRPKRVDSNNRWIYFSCPMARRLKS